MACCKGCPERHTACHDSCERYKAEHKQRVSEAKWLQEKNAFYRHNESRRDMTRRKKPLKNP